MGTKDVPIKVRLKYFELVPYGENVPKKALLYEQSCAFCQTLDTYISLDSDMAFKNSVKCFNSFFRD